MFFPPMCSWQVQHLLPSLTFRELGDALDNFSRHEASTSLVGLELHKRMGTMADPALQ